MLHPTQMGILEATAGFMMPLPLLGAVRWPANPLPLPKGSDTPPIPGGGTGFGRYPPPNIGEGAAAGLGAVKDEAGAAAGLGAGAAASFGAGTTAGFGAGTAAGFGAGAATGFGAGAATVFGAMKDGAGAGSGFGVMKDGAGAGSVGLRGWETADLGPAFLSMTLEWNWRLGINLGVIVSDFAGAGRGILEIGYAG